MPMFVKFVEKRVNGTMLKIILRQNTLMESQSPAIFVIKLLGQDTHWKCTSLSTIETVFAKLLKSLTRPDTTFVDSQKSKILYK